MTSVNIGLSETHRQKMSDELGTVLADSYTLYLQTHNFHWNVTGPQFRELHLMFEEQYNELAVAVDDLAERIRTLGFAAPATYSEFVRLANIKEVAGVPEAAEMVRILTDSNETVVRGCRQALAVAQAGDDESTAALIGDRMRVHEKTAWMLRSMV
ncbi:MAG: Dps family protein [Gammaproteobacteria bacterium]